MLKRIAAVSVGLLALSLCAFGSSSTETDWTLLGGSVSWNGLSTGTLSGSGITALNLSNLLSVYGGSMSFTSGTYNGAPGTWSWGAGTITMTGCIQGVTTAANVKCTSSNDHTVLFTDSFSNISINSSGMLVLGSNSGSYANSAVASYFGVPLSFSSTSRDYVLTGSKPGSSITNGLNLGGMLKDGPSVNVAESWSPSLTLGLFAFAIAAFGAACRLGLLRPVKF